MFWWTAMMTCDGDNSNIEYMFNMGNRNPTKEGMVQRIRILSLSIMLAQNRNKSKPGLIFFLLSIDKRRDDKHYYTIVIIIYAFITKYDITINQQEDIYVLGVCRYVNRIQAIRNLKEF